jgi:branched-chain amino acid aminotransferase
MSGNVYLNGRIVPATEAVLSVNDRAVLFGDAAYETMRSYGGRFFRFPGHLARLRRTLAGMSLPLPVSDAEITEGALELVRVNGVPDARLRLTVTGGTHDGAIRLRRSNPPNLILTAEPLVPPPAAAYRDGVGIVMSRWVVPTGSPLARIKAANRLLHLMAKEEAMARGAWDAVFLDEDGHVLEGTNTNVFFVVDGTLRTASLEEPLLAGVTRDTVLEVAREGGVPVREGRVTRDEVARAGEAFLTSTTIELLPVSRVDDRPLGGRDRPVWRELTRRFRRAVERETGVAREDLPGTV